MGGWYEGGIVDGGGKLTQDRMADADAEKVTAKQSSNADENKVDEKREWEKPCTVMIDTSPSVSLVHLGNLISGKVGFLVTQERMTDSDAAKVDVNVKADAPDAYNNTSKINTLNIDVKIGIVKPCAVSIYIS